MRRCERCGGPLPEGCRSIRRFCDDGDCRRGRKREWARTKYWADPEPLRARSREWANRPENAPKRQERYRRWWAQTNPEYKQQKREQEQERVRERYSSDPAYRERTLAQQREGMRRRMSDPDQRARYYAYQNEYRRERYSTDPEYRERLREEHAEVYEATVNAKLDAMQIDPVEVARRVQENPVPCPA